MTDYCKYVNVFQGSGEIELPTPKGIAAKWFFIKAGCGNTHPAAVLPYGRISAGPYSGGYPTGYGNHLPNSFARPNKFEDGKKLIGFSHIHQSGTGAIGYYYNYAVVTPKYSTSDYRREPVNEKAEPGFYGCQLEDILCELTTDEKTAYHRYSFSKSGGSIEIDFSNNGLNIPDWDKERVHSLTIEKQDDNTVTASAIIEGIKICFAATADCTLKEITERKAIFTVNENKTVNLKLSASLIDCQTALNNLKTDAFFDTVRKNAYGIWNNQLSKIKIHTEDTKILEIFYSNLYHSYIKPANWHSESFVYDKNKPFMVDFATLWDMYKTALPLIFLTDKRAAEDIAETLLSLGEKTGTLPNGFGLTDRYLDFSDQARVLGIYALITAYRYGIDISPDRMLRVIKNDIFSEEKKDFVQNGRCISHTFVLDMADACALSAQIADEQGDYELKDALLPLAAFWKNVYDENTGLLKNDCPYYEGTNYNYSFRQLVSMDERIELAGGKDGFIRLLDDFFGYGKEDVAQPLSPFDYSPVEEGMKLGRFEGFNNESDTEAPYSYIYAGRHDRTCEILRAGMKYMFTTGKGGLPGNNDSGALSSYYVFSAVGIYPLAGHNVFLVGSPFVDSAEIELSSGKRLFIRVNENSDNNIYVKKLTFNGKEIEDAKIPVKDILNGGELVFTMSPAP